MFARKLGWPPTRQQAIWGVIVIAVIVGVTGLLTNGVIAGLSLLLGFPGVLSLILYFLPSRPKIRATLRGKENAIISDTEVGLIIGAERTVRPFDIDQIVKTEEHAALETMPRAPMPKVPPGSALAPMFTLNQSTANMLHAVSGASDEELEKFMQRVRRYGEKLRTWLEELQASRVERLRAFTAIARAGEEGQAPADFARMRLRFPEEFERESDHQWCRNHLHVRNSPHPLPDALRGLALRSSQWPEERYLTCLTGLSSIAFNTQTRTA